MTDEELTKALEVEAERDIALDRNAALEAAHVQMQASLDAMAKERDRLRNMLDAATYSLCTDDYETQQTVAADLKGDNQQYPAQKPRA